MISRTRTPCTTTWPPNRVERISRSEEVSWLDELPHQLGARFGAPTADRYGHPDLRALARGRLIAAASPGASYQTELGGIDVRAREVFVMRLLAVEGPLTGAAIALRFQDGEGRTATVPAAPHLGAHGLGCRFGDLIVPLEALRIGGLDLGALALLEVRLDVEGAILIDDLRFE